MKTGETKYYRVEQLKKNDKVIGNLVLIGRSYGYIVQLHYFNIAGYKTSKQFDYFKQAENYFDNILKTEG